MSKGKIHAAIKWKTAKQLHKFAECFNWDDGDAPMHDVARQPQCDLGTALMIYWLAEPTYWFVRYADRKQVERDQRSEFDFLIEIEEKVAAGFYRTQKIKFDPGDFDGHDLTQIVRGEKWKRRVPREMYGPHYSGPKARPKRITVKDIMGMNSKELNNYVMTTPWDDDGSHIRAVLNHPKCDRGTALAVYWRNDPHYFDEYRTAGDVDETSMAGYKLITMLERRLLSGFYKRNSIRYDPRNDRGTNWTRDDYHLPKNRKIPKELLKPNLDSRAR